MTGTTERINGSVILTAPWNQYIATGLKRFDECCQTSWNAIELPRSSSGNVSLRPEVRLLAFSVVLFLVQSVVRLNVSDRITQSRCHAAVCQS